jgi:hypothetical protein
MLLFKRTPHWGYGFAGKESGGNGTSPGPSGSAPPGPAVPGSDSSNGLHDDSEGR